MKELTGPFEHVVLAVVKPISFEQEITAGLIILGMTIMSGIIGFILRRLFAKVDKNDEVGKENSKMIGILSEDQERISKDVSLIKESINEIKLDQALQNQSGKNINSKLDDLIAMNVSFKDNFDTKIGELHARITKVQGAD